MTSALVIAGQTVRFTYTGPVNVGDFPSDLYLIFNGVDYANPVSQVQHSATSVDVTFDADTNPGDEWLYNDDPPAYIDASQFGLLT